jgi:hypothetical protein
LQIAVSARRSSADHHTSTTPLLELLAGSRCIHLEGTRPNWHEGQLRLLVLYTEEARPPLPHHLRPARPPGREGRGAREEQAILKVGGGERDGRKKCFY